MNSKQEVCDYLDWYLGFFCLFLILKITWILKVAGHLGDLKRTLQIINFMQILFLAYSY